MKFTCNKSILAKQVSQVGKIVTSRSNLPILSNLLIETDKKVIHISSTDLEIAITTQVPAEITQEGSFTIPARLFQDFISQNPDENISFELEGFDLICKSSKVEARIPGLDPEDYPALPKVENGIKVVLPVEEFTQAMKQVIIACATDQTRPVLTGVYIQLIDDEAIFAATDGFRLVERKINIVPINKPLSVLIPGRTIQEIIRITAGNELNKDLELIIEEQQALFKFDSVEIYSRLLTGNFPKYHDTIPKKFLIDAEVTAPELIQALKLTYVFSNSGIANVMFDIDEKGVMTIYSHGSMKGKSKHVVSAVLKDGFEPLKVAFNTKYMLDACNAANTPFLKLCFSGKTSPLVIKTDKDDYIQIVMPIRVD